MNPPGANLWCAIMRGRSSQQRNPRRVYMSIAAFPDFVTNLPEADIPFPGVRGRISQAPDHQIIFMEIEPIGSVAPHRHGAQWGIVVEGEMELTIGGITRRYRSGDSYFIPAEVEHAATFPTKVRVIDVFADVNRYRPKI
jgi:quercetin dioxygenase-like cupin family protein